MRKAIFLILLVSNYVLHAQLFIETIKLTSAPDKIPVGFKISKVSSTLPARDTITNHKGWQWAIEKGMIGGITSYIDEQYESTTEATFVMNINDYNFIVDGNKKWRSWLDVSFYQNGRGEVFRTGSWEDLESMPGQEKAATLIKTLVHECLVLFNSYLHATSQNPDETNTTNAQGFFLDQNMFLSGQPYFNDKVTIQEIELDGEGIGMYSIQFEDHSTYDKSLGGLVFGYTDGKDTYISTRNYQNTTAFSKVVKQGKDWVIFYHNKIPEYKSLTAGAVARNVILGALTGIAVVPYFHKYEGNVVLDFKDNEILKATFSELKLKLSQNKELKNAAKQAGYDHVKENLDVWWQKVLESR